ncbi:unnamed protein product, partial [Symbiodinium pilosum]
EEILQILVADARNGEEEEDIVPMARAGEGETTLGTEEGLRPVPVEGQCEDGKDQTGETQMAEVDDNEGWDVEIRTLEEILESVRAEGGSTCELQWGLYGRRI